MEKGVISIKEYKAFIFDMDGLLLDTEKICWECFRKACSKFDYDPDFDIYKKCIGRKAEEGNKILKQGFDPFIPFDDVHKLWGDLYSNYIDRENIPLKKGVRSVLENLHRRNVKLAVATSTEETTALKKLTRSGLIDFFDLIISGDQVTNSKPDPEIYLTAARKLEIKPENCIAFEDSDNGVKSAHSAKMTVIQIVDMIDPAEEVRNLNHIIVNSFNEISFV